MALSRKAAYGMGLYTCNRCRSCTRAEAAGGLPVCPSYHHWGFFSHSGGGRVYAARGLLDGKVPRTRASAQAVYECLACGACEASCPEGIETQPLILDTRSEFVEAGEVPPRVRRVLDREWAALKWEVEVEGPPGSPRVATPGGAELKAVAAVSSAARQAPIARVRNGVGCGATALELGDFALWRAQADRVLEGVERWGAREILAVDPPSAWSLRRRRDETGSALKVVTLPEALLEALGSKSVRLRSRPPVRVTYHDPCRLARGLGFVDEPRAVLRRLPGVELVEMPRSGRFALCCGGGSSAPEIQPELSRETRDERAREAAASGAQVLLTACPVCRERLAPPLRRRMRVEGLASFVASRLR